MPTKDSVLDWRGQTMVSSEGGKIGKIEDIYLDQDTGEPEWALVHTGLFGSKSSFVPIGDAREQDGQVSVAFAKDTVTGAPKMDPDGELSPSDEADLYGHYGLDYADSQSDGPTVGSDVSGEETDGAMTRSEEELHVGTAQRETGRARLRKYVVTENVTKTVPVQREEVRIEREPITDANRDAATSGPDLSEEEHEVVLHAEEAVVDKRAVPKERVRLDKDTVTEERQVTEDVSKERIDLTGAEGERTDEGVSR